MTTAPLCFLDTETDGVHPGRKAWEIACIRREPDGTETEWQAYIDIDLSTADPFGLRVGRFYDRHPLGVYLANRQNPLNLPKYDMTLLEEAAVRSAGLSRGSGYRPVTYGPVRTITSLEEAAERVAQFTHGAHVVGAVPNFDTEVLAQLLRSQGLAPAWHYHLVDIENLAVGYLAAKGTPLAPPWNSDALTTALAVDPADPEERHTALGDARWAKRVYDAVMVASTQTAQPA